MNTRRVKPAAKRSYRAWHVLVTGLAVTLLVLVVLASKASRAQAANVANGCVATTSIGTTYSADAAEDFGSKVQDANIVSLTDANTTNGSDGYAQWTTGGFHYQVYRFAVQAEGDIGLINGQDVNPGAGYPTINCTGTIDPKTGEIPWTNAANQTIYPVGVQLGVPNMGAANNNGLWETGALSGGTTPAALDGPTGGPVYQNDQQSAAAVVDDGGGALINGNTVWCQAISSPGYTPSCPKDITNYTATDPTDPLDLPGAGFMFTAPNCHTTGTTGNGDDNAQLKCGASDFGWYGNGNTDLVANGDVPATDAVNSQTGVIHPFTLSMIAENTHADGFQAAMYLTFKYPATIAPSVTVSTDCSNNQLDYTILNTTATGQAQGFVNNVLIGTRPVPPYSNPFTIPAGDATGSFQVVVTLNTLAGTQIIQSTVLAYDCTGAGNGAPPPPPGSAACIFPLAFDPDAPLTWDPGEKVSITANVEFTPPPVLNPDPIPAPPGGYTITTVLNETIAITAPGWAAQSMTTPPVAATPGKPSHVVSDKFPETVPPSGTYGPFDVQWQFSYNISVVTVSYKLVSFTNKFGTFSFYVPIYSPAVMSTVTPAPTAPCVQPGAGTVPGSPGGVPTAGQPGGPGGPGTGGPANPNQEIDIKPYVRVYGGDIAAGDDFCTPAGTGGETMAGIFGWAKEGIGLQGWSGGAATQLAAEATRDGGGGTAGDIDAFASASNVMGSDNKPPPTGLSFSNTANYTYQNMQAPIDANEGYGGELVQLPDGTCQGVNGVDYFNAMPTAGVGTYNQGDLLSGGTFEWLHPGNTLTLGNQILGVDPTTGIGQHTVLYVDGNVQITGPIQFATGSGVGESFNNITAAPSFTLIAKGNISIDPGVPELDGVYIAEPSSVGGVDGVIDTCDATHDANYYSQCSTNQLIIDGSLIASKIALGRAINTVDQSTASETSDASSAAEVINYNPLLWMQTQTVLSQTDDSIVSLPPVGP